MTIGPDGQGAPPGRARDTAVTAVAVRTGILCPAAEALRTTTADETPALGTAPTFVTGLRGSAIVGSAAIPGTGKTGGLLCNLLMSTLTALPVATANGASFRGTIGSPPMDPASAPRPACCVPRALCPSPGGLDPLWPFAYPTSNSSSLPLLP
jgi:hypothetical protein